MGDNHTINGKRHVQITIESRTGDTCVVQQAVGELYLKGRQVYLRYREPVDADMGNTVTIVHIAEDQIRIIRRGDVEFEQTFSLGLSYNGYLLAAEGRLEIRTVTESIDIQCPQAWDDPYTVQWCYELSVMGERAGRYSIMLTALPIDKPSHEQAIL